LFECLPVFVKLMSPKGPYDVAVGKLYEADIYYAEREKERNIEVTDSTYSHHLEEDIQKQKRIITAQSDYDLERHLYD
jgi:hypothetical protein